jgi:hypothetical protein
VPSRKPDQLALSLTPLLRERKEFMKYRLYSVWLYGMVLTTDDGEVAWPFSVAQRHANEVGGEIREQFR